jgi:hypothetical protein
MQRFSRSSNADSRTRRPDAVTKAPQNGNNTATLPSGIFEPKTAVSSTDHVTSRDRKLIVWHSIVEDFTRRKLSVPADREAAISSIVAEIGGYWDDVYLAGTWNKTLVQDLAWYNKDVYHARSKDTAAFCAKPFQTPINGPS